MNTSENVPITIDSPNSCSRDRILENSVESIEMDEDCKITENLPLLRNDNEDSFIHDHQKATKRKNLWKDPNWGQKMVVIYVCLVNYFSSLCISVSSPFLARVMLVKGGTVVLSTIVLQISMLTGCIASVIFGKYQARIGSKTLIVSGQVFFSLLQISFGTIEYIENHWVLLAVGTLLRALQGVCEAAITVAGLTIACQKSPDYRTIIFGIFEASYGAGYLTGPYLGGFLYDWSGGMMAPIAIPGLISLLFAFAGFRILKKTDNGEQPGLNSYVGRILSNPGAVFIFGIAGTVLGGLGLGDATITVYLKKKGFSATKVGQLLFLMGASYCLFAVCIGFVINSGKVLRRLVISLGVFGAVAFPFLWVPNQLESWIYVAGFGMGVSAAIALTPAFNELCQIVESDGIALSDMSVNSALSGLWSASLSICNFSVPLIGSALQSALPFYASLVAALLIGYGFTIFATLISAYCKRTSKR